MPFPETQNVGKIMSHIKSHHRSWPKDKKIAASLSHARKMGADIKKNPYQQAVDREKV